MSKDKQYPRWTETTDAREAIVPGFQRLDDGAVFVGSFENRRGVVHRQGTLPVLVLARYRTDGYREIYLIAPENEEREEQRYANHYQTLPPTSSNDVLWEIERKYGIPGRPEGWR